MGYTWKQRAKGAVKGAVTGAVASGGNPYAIGGGAVIGGAAPGLTGETEATGPDSVAGQTAEVRQRIEELRRQQYQMRQQNLEKAMGFFQPWNAELEAIYGIKMPTMASVGLTDPFKAGLVRNNFTRRPGFESGGDMFTRGMYDQPGAPAPPPPAALPPGAMAAGTVGAGPFGGMAPTPRSPFAPTAKPPTFVMNSPRKEREPRKRGDHTSRKPGSG